MKEKHIEDIRTLAGAMKRCDSIPCTLLKNGKQGKEKFAKSQAKQREKEGMGVVDCVMADALLLGEGGKGCVDSECKSTGLEDLATVSRASDNGVTRGGDNGIHGNVSFCVFQSSDVESINALRQDVGGLHSEIR